MKNEQLGALIEKASRIVFLGGAGVSTESGIPDFRSAGGLYSREKYGVSPEEILSVGYFYSHTDKFYEFYRSSMIYPDAKPNDAHYALAALEKAGKLNAVITQNIDGLHTAAGSKTVLELHGSIHRNRCVHCGKSYPLSYILSSPGVPRCTACGNIVKPDVVLYGEGLDPDTLYKADCACAEADLMIVGGTSLNVYPAAAFADDFRGEHLVIINMSPTPYDSYASLLVREPIGTVLRDTLDK